MDCKRKKISMRWGARAILLLGVFMMMGAGVGAAQAASPTGPQAATAQAIPQPQFFCGTCHILTYPEIIDKQHALWKKSKHNQVGCVQCHYGPDPSKAGGKNMSAGHISKQPPDNFSHLQIGGPIVRTRPHIDNASCVTGECHGKAGDDFKTRKIKFTEKVTFVHKPHFEEKNQVKGQKIGCTTCHQHETDQKKFEVSKDTCFLCHFMGTKLNDGKARCELCHKLPEAPIKGVAAQSGGDSWGGGSGGSGGSGGDAWGSEPAAPAAKAAPAIDGWGQPVETAAGKPEAAAAQAKPITHAMIQKAGVSCVSCHFDLVQSGTGASYSAFFENGVLKTAVVYGVGRIKKENCQACHDKDQDLKQALAMEELHQKHVTTKNARCLDCHQPVIHMKAKLDERTPQDDDPVLLTGCLTCHSTPHYYQRVLTSGIKSPAQDPVPDPMYIARVNCLGCHNQKTTLPEGHTVLTASGKACIACHEKKYEKTLLEWKTEINQKVQAVSREDAEIANLFKKVEGKSAKGEIDKMTETLSKAQENLKIVKFGKGVHNKKYALMLLDESSQMYKDLKDALVKLQKK
ncbi:MAG: hypothetical protein Q8P24_05980 [Desulfobacterales bacterium]|nr:hypothetical protein [Desulfobacterales bacterium]